MATYTHPRAASGASIKAVHAGVNSESAVYSFSNTMSSGDIVNLFKVPAGAVVVDVITFNTQATAAVCQFGVGDDGSAERYMASISATGITRATAGLLYSYSATGTIRATVSGSISNSTIGGTIRVTVLYKMDDPVVTN
jgi:hypothetical protein